MQADLNKHNLEDIAKLINKDEDNFRTAMNEVRTLAISQDPFLEGF